MSVRLGMVIHRLEKAVKEVMRVMRSRRRFRVVLDRENRQLLMAEPLASVVIEIDVRHFYFSRRKA